MAEKIRSELLSFLVPDAALLRVLVVESLEYLPQLQKMFPKSELHALAAECDPADIPTGVHWQELDYVTTPLPYERKYFDYIISDLALENVDNPQDIAAGFSLFLKDTGALLTSFRNIRHWSVLQNLMDGHYYSIVSRLYARAEFEKLLYASFYKSVLCQPQQRKAPPGMIDRLVTAGFENHDDDLEAEFYMIRADRSMPELSLIKSMYTSEQRRHIVRLLHRIEYDVVRVESTRSLWDEVTRLNIFPAYLAALIHETVVHTERFYRALFACSQGHDVYIQQLLHESAAESIDPVQQELYLSLQRECTHEE
ncbi:hypothetical protein [Selenomonas sp. oral taxon 478]|uniref:hypothetical protein n=1 Tax=Selenomonas sp. oral taxon 478 TaxID=712538 RepID=UPI00067A07EB|nr:hypothetical protein [Selenomonas sp. oral taxon 478]AKT54661.1 hypothetical protein ADJ74_09540 [Selenomonas sp. oral taxon 478]